MIIRCSIVYEMSSKLDYIFKDEVICSLPFILFFFDKIAWNSNLNQFAVILAV